MGWAHHCCHHLNQLTGTVKSERVSKRSAPVKRGRNHWLEPHFPLRNHEEEGWATGSGAGRYANDIIPLQNRCYWITQTPFMFLQAMFFYFAERLSRGKKAMQTDMEKESREFWLRRWKTWPQAQSSIARVAAMPVSPFSIISRRVLKAFSKFPFICTAEIIMSDWCYVCASSNSATKCGVVQL